MRSQCHVGNHNGGGVAERRHQVYGLHAASAALETRPQDVVAAAILDSAHGGKLKTLVRALEDHGIEVQRLTRAALDKRCRGVHQGVVLELRPRGSFSLGDFEDLVLARGRALRLLVLDQVEDPRNLGACLRTADAAAVDAVIAPRSRSASLTSTAIKAATGAAETVPFVAVTNLARTLAWLKSAGVWVVGTDASARRSLHDAKLDTPIAVVLGAEGKGMRRLTREACDELVSIPMFGTVESLNVSVAAGLVLFELLRQAPPHRARPG